MAILSYKNTGIPKGFISIRVEKVHSGKSHIHFFYDVKKQKTEYMKFSIDVFANIEIIEQKNIKVNKQQIEDIKKFIGLNKEILKDYYEQGEMYITSDFLNEVEAI